MTDEPPIWRLRDLKPLMEVEALFAKANLHKNPLWAVEFDQANEKLPGACQRCFGVTPDEAWYPIFLTDVDAAEADRLQTAFDQAKDAWIEVMETDREAAFWRGHGWDVLDEKGEVLLIADEIARVLIMVSLGIGGRRPGAPLSDQEAREEARSWGAALEDEARKFRSKRP